MTKLTFEKLEQMKKLVELKKQIKKFSPDIIIEVFTHQFMESFKELLNEDEKYWEVGIATLEYLVHLMEEKEKKNFD